MAGPIERIQVLDEIEKDIITCLQCAGTHLVTVYFKYFMMRIT